MTNGVIVQSEHFLLVSLQLNHCSAVVLVPLKNTTQLGWRQNKTHKCLKKKKRGCTSVQMISAHLSSLLPQDNHDGFVVTFGDDRFKHVLLHIWRGHTRVTSLSLHRVFLTLLKQYGKSKNVRLRRNSDSPSTIRPSSVRHTQEVGVRTSSTSICGDGKAFSFKTTGSEAEDETDIVNPCSGSWYFSTLAL